MNTAMIAPLRDLEAFQNRIFANRIPANAEKASVPGWASLADIVEDSDGYGITLDIPGLDRQAIQLELENRVLTVSGERPKIERTEGRRIHRIERPAGWFRRSFLLPEDADLSRIEARSADGVLRIAVAKREDSRPKKIEVTVG